MLDGKPFLRGARSNYVRVDVGHVRYLPYFGSRRPLWSLPVSRRSPLGLAHGHGPRGLRTGSGATASAGSSARGGSSDSGFVVASSKLRCSRSRRFSKSSSPRDRTKGRGGGRMRCMACVIFWRTGHAYGTIWPWMKPMDVDRVVLTYSRSVRRTPRCPKRLETCRAWPWGWAAPEVRGRHGGRTLRDILGPRSLALRARRLVIPSNYWPDLNRA